MFLNIKDMVARVKCAGTAAFLALPVFIFMVACSLLAALVVFVAAAFTAALLGHFVSFTQVKLGVIVAGMVLVLAQLFMGCISFASYIWSGGLKRAWLQRNQSFLKTKQLFAYLFKEASRPEARTFLRLAAINIASILGCTVVVGNLAQGDQVTFLSSFTAVLAICALLLTCLYIGWSIVHSVLSLPEESVEGLFGVVHIPLWSLILMDVLNLQSSYAGFIPVAGILLAAAVLGFCYKCGGRQSGYLSA